jgi:two-component system invasion response regulator UvrY
VAPDPITILLVDDHPVVREGYRRLFEQTPDIRVIAEAGNGESGYHAYVRHQPDVVVMDLSMPGMGGLEVVRRLLARDRAAKVLVFSAHENEVFRQRASEAGALGYISKRAAAKVMVEAVRKIAQGERFFSPFCQAEASSPKPESQDLIDKLTPREFEVFRHLAEGRTVAEIAELLHASHKTVGVHQTHIMKKLGLSNAAQLTRLAIRHGLVDP